MSKTVGHINSDLWNVQGLQAIWKDFGDVRDVRKVVVMETERDQVLADDHVTFYQVSTLIDPLLPTRHNTECKVKV